MSKILEIIKQPLTHEWSTPQPFFDGLDQEFRFTLDAAASADNAKCIRYFDIDADGLSQAWDNQTVWCNPPYGDQVGRWVAKSHEAAQAGATVVMLIPARTDTAWWHRFAMQADEVRLVRGRLRFSGATTNAPFPSAVVIFRPGTQGPPVWSVIDRQSVAS